MATNYERERRRLVAAHREEQRRRLETARLAELIASDPFQPVDVARPTGTAKRRRRFTDSELRAMGEACAAEYVRLYGER